MNLPTLTAMAIIPIIGTTHGPDWTPAVPPPIATMTIKSAKYCQGPQFWDGPLLIRKHERPLPAEAVTLNLTVLVSYRNPAAVPMLLSPWHRTNEFIGATSDHLIGPRKRKDPDILDVAPASGRIHGLPLLQVPIEEVIPPKGASRLPVPHEIVQTVYLPGRTKENLLGQKIWFQLELVHWPFSKRLGQELMAQQDARGAPWTGTVRTNILEFDIPLSPATEKCVATYRID